MFSLSTPLVYWLSSTRSTPPGRGLSGGCGSSFGGPVMASCKPPRSSCANAGRFKNIALPSAMNRFGRVGMHARVEMRDEAERQRQARRKMPAVVDGSEILVEQHHWFDRSDVRRVRDERRNTAVVRR